MIPPSDAFWKRWSPGTVIRHGYNVEIAKGGEDEIVFMQSDRAAAVDLILLDLAMSDLDCFEALQQVKSRRPDLPASY